MKHACSKEEWNTKFALKTWTRRTTWENWEYCVNISVWKKKKLEWKGWIVLLGLWFKS